ncbi:MerR family transcriptional regulator [Streptomyces sp. P38-E01]|uniref:MerR family transcriptional regulator n=1 Tax=Streptomyces tardus TaxID=2780544 RepID=A0A949JQZ6_9ACTN|nr:MerR family transcriptional regulator [Streptomyces tardus]MBU7600654.1 MerR family transcriptional regulator [Streptomyces tardus]
MTEQTEDTGPAALTVDELAARAGVTVRTIRFYSTRGLLPPPRIGPRRVGRYDHGHLARLALIEELQSQGMTLSAIERYLQRLPEEITAQDLAIHRALVASWMPDSADEVTREQLERRAGRPLADADIERLEAMNVLVRGQDPSVFEVDAGLLPLGVRLLELPISQEAVVRSRQLMLDHARQLAGELSKLFREEVWDPYRSQEPDEEEVERMKTLSAHMQPLVVQALLTAFQRSLREELRGTFPEERAPQLGPR